jgi:hypothetical protein
MAKHHACIFSLSCRELTSYGFLKMRAKIRFIHPSALSGATLFVIGDD